MILEDLKDLLQVSIAFSLAYLALDRFRYVKKIIQLYREAIDEVEKSTRSAKRDELETNYNISINNILEGDSQKIFYKFYGSHDKHGWDNYIVGSLLFSQLAWLVVATVLPEMSNHYETDDKILTICYVAISSVVTMVVPIVFIFFGNRKIRKIKKSLKEDSKHLKPYTGLKEKVDLILKI